MIGTSRSFRDGDVIGPAAALFFTSLDRLHAFLARDGHGALRDFGSNIRDFVLDVGFGMICL